VEKKHNCEACAFRKKYDNGPTSFLGRLWRWHAGFCPGWKSYMNSLPQKDRTDLAIKYNLKKFQ
jgi:hypothetical protein